MTVLQQVKDESESDEMNQSVAADEGTNTERELHSNFSTSSSCVLNNVNDSSLEKRTATKLDVSLPGVKEGISDEVVLPPVIGDCKRSFAKLHESRSTIVGKGVDIVTDRGCGNKNSAVTYLQFTQKYQNKQILDVTGGDNSLTDDDTTFFDEKAYLTVLQSNKESSTTLEESPPECVIDLTVAVPVDESERYLPFAVELDPDKKNSSSITPSQRLKVRKSIVGSLLFFVVVTAIAVGVTFGMKGDKVINDNRSYPRQIDIKEMIVLNIPSIADELQDPTSPYAKALQWLIYDDPQQLEPNQNRTVLQRYLMAYFYFATAVDQDWRNCPSNITSRTSKGISRSNRTQSDSTTTPLPCQTFSYSKYTGLTVLRVSPVGWLANKSECLWPGVTCDEQGQVVIIELVGVGFNGQIPDTMHLLPFLRRLCIIANNITGKLPDVSFRYLSSLEVSVNQLSGTIPSSFSQESRLLYFVLMDYNHIDVNYDSISKDTKAFMVDSSEYNRSLTNEQIDQTQSLSFLSMSNTKLRGSIPPSLWTLPFLSKLEMSDNFLTGPLPSGPMSKEVQVLHLEMNQITGSIPDSLYNALNLAIFFLHENRMNGTISPNISNLQLLSRFTIDGNLVSGTVPSEIGSLRQLRDLSLSGTFLIGQVPTELCGLRKLGLSTLKADCLLDVNTGSSEIVCPEECCTICCKADGTTCQIMDNP